MLVDGGRDRDDVAGPQVLEVTAEAQALGLGEFLGRELLGRIDAATQGLDPPLVDVNPRTFRLLANSAARGSST